MAARRTDTQTFDRVIVVDGGRIVEDGAPAMLRCSAGSRYRWVEAEALLRAELSADAGLVCGAATVPARAFGWRPAGGCARSAKHAGARRLRRR
jgi:hypothetical protein